MRRHEADFREMQGMLLYALEKVDTTAVPIERQEEFLHLLADLLGRSPIPGLRRYVNAAVMDASYITLGALAVCEQEGVPEEDRAMVAHNSTGLLRLGGIPDEAESALKVRWAIENGGDGHGGTPYIPGSKLVLNDHPQTGLRVDYTPGAAAEIATLRQPGRGCPATGRIMTDYYQRYVRTIFGTDEPGSIAL